MARDKKGLRFRQDEAQKSEEEVAKRVVLDYATVKTAVQTIREFEKEYGISILERKGLEQASNILKKYEQQDKLQRFVEDKIIEKITPLDDKLSRLTEMVASLIPVEQEKESQQEPSVKDAPEYSKRRLPLQ